MLQIPSRTSTLISFVVRTSANATWRRVTSASSTLPQPQIQRIAPHYHHPNAGGRTKSSSQGYRGAQSQQHRSSSLVSSATIAYAKCCATEEATLILCTNSASTYSTTKTRHAWCLIHLLRGSSTKSSTPYVNLLFPSHLMTGRTVVQRCALFTLSLPTPFMTFCSEEKDWLNIIVMLPPPTK